MTMMIGRYSVKIIWRRCRSRDPYTKNRCEGVVRHEYGHYFYVEKQSAFKKPIPLVPSAIKRIWYDD